MSNRVSARGVTGLALFLTCAVAAPVFAQSQPDVPRGEVSVGVAAVFEQGRVGPGIPISASIRPWRHVSLVAEAREALMGGVRFQGTGRVAPFAEVLVGLLPLEDLRPHIGVGADVRLRDRLAARIGVDFHDGGDDGFSHVATRVAASLVFLIGRR